MGWMPTRRTTHSFKTGTDPPNTLHHRDRGYRTSGGFSAAYPALYLCQLDLGGVRLTEIDGLLLAIHAVVEVPVRPTLAPLLQLQHPAAVGSPLDDGAGGSGSRKPFLPG